MNELELVVLKRDIPEHGLARGDVGTVVHVYDDGVAYEVEFILASGETVAVLTLESDDVRPRGGKEILHTRSLG
jgi:hypothetical protein